MSKLGPSAQALELEHAVLQAVMENAPLPLAQVEGPDHVVWSINPAFCTMLGRPADDLIGKPFAHLFPQSVRSLELLDRVLRSGEGEAHVVVDGDEANTHYGAFTCWPIRAGAARLGGLMIQVTETSVLQQRSIAVNEALLISAVQQHELTDVADRLNVQLVKEIAERERAEVGANQLAAIVASSDDAILSTDLDGIITSWNGGAEKIFGYTAGETMGTSIMRLIPDDRQPEGAQLLEKIKRIEKSQHVETVRQTKDGRMINVSLTASPIRDAAGMVIGVSKVTRDITKRKHLELTLEQTAKDLAEVDRRKSEFLATLAHELRNPLAPLRNGLELLSMADHDRATWDQAQGMMKRQLDHMVRLIDELMDLSRISRGTVDLRLERVDLRTVLDQAVEVCKPLIERHDHTLAVDIPDEPVMVEGDSMRLIQVFSNLLNNSAKYTDNCGAITVHLAVHDNGVQVSVDDNGIGIAQDQLGKVFDMFAQVERTNDRVQGGLGIGLNIVKHLVSMHGGSITVRSEGLGKGSRFTVRLPLSAVPEKKTDVVEPAIAVKTIAPKRILIVDDNVDAAAMMALLMGKMGHELRVANNGEEALAVGAELLPDVVLMDLGMPIMDGFAACRQMRRTPWGAKALIVALSGWGQDQDRAKSKEAGFDHHLVKPIGSGAVLEVIGEKKGDRSQRP